MFSEMWVWMCRGGVWDAARAPREASAVGEQVGAKRGVMMGFMRLDSGSSVWMWDIVSSVADVEDCAESSR